MFEHWEGAKISVTLYKWKSSLDLQIFVVQKYPHGCLNIYLHTIIMVITFNGIAVIILPCHKECPFPDSIATIFQLKNYHILLAVFKLFAILM